MNAIQETDGPAYVMLEPASGRKDIVEQITIIVLPKGETDSLHITGRVVFAGNVLPLSSKISNAALLIGPQRYDGVTVQINRVGMETEDVRAHLVAGGEAVLVPGPTRTWWDVLFRR